MRASRWTLIALLLTVWGFALATSGEASAQSYDAEETQFLELINAYRQENGLEPLLLSAPLSVASERHSEDMGTYGFFSHTSVQSSYYPAGSGHVERIAQEGYDYNTYTSENVAWGQATAEEVFEAWRASPGHNTNMLGAYKVIGIGLVTTNGTPYWTTDFGAYVDPSAGGSGGGNTASDTVVSEDSPVERVATPDASDDADATANAQAGADDAQYAGTDDAQYADDDQYTAGGADDDQYTAGGADGDQYASPATSHDDTVAAPGAAPDTAAVPASDDLARTATDRDVSDDMDAVDGGSGASSGAASSAGSAAASMGMTTLPDTGGFPPMLLAASVLLICGGLLVRRLH